MSMIIDHTHEASHYHHNYHYHYYLDHMSHHKSF